MSSKREIAEKVVSYLMPLGPVRARGMFGGFGLFHEDLMFGLIAYDRPYFKVDEETKARFGAAGGKPFVYDGKTKPMEMSYWSLPDEISDDPDALLPWAELGLEAARRVRAKKPAKKRRKAKA